MSIDFKIIEYNKLLHTVKIGDYIKISIHFEKCFDMTTFKIATNVIENIWTYVTSIDFDEISVSISNHMFYKSIDNPDFLNADNIIKIKKSNIKEIKRYTEKTRQKKIEDLVKLINKLPFEYRFLLESLDNNDCEEIFEQIFNRNICSIK